MSNVSLRSEPVAGGLILAASPTSGQTLARAGAAAIRQQERMGSGTVRHNGTHVRIQLRHRSGHIIRRGQLAIVEIVHDDSDRLVIAGLRRREATVFLREPLVARGNGADLPPQYPWVPDMMWIVLPSPLSSAAMLFSALATSLTVQGSWKPQICTALGVLGLRLTRVAMA